MKANLFTTLTTILFFLFYLPGIQGQEQVITITETGKGSWTVPCDVTSITVEAWGGGGGGGGSIYPRGASGGGGGAYASSVLPVTPGQVIEYRVGAGGAGGIGNSAGTNGTVTWFGNSSTNPIIKADRGDRGRPARSSGNVTVGAGGSAANSIGDIIIEGEDGGAGGDDESGAGGDAGGDDGGAGGAGRINSGNGYDGSLFGGGGSGAYDGSSTGRDGGAGAGGAIRITFNTELQTYCPISFTGSRTITKVVFAGIENTSSGSASYESFCDEAEVDQGSLYSMSVTAGQSSQEYQVRVYIDWDQDGVFGNNPNEIYDFDKQTNSSTPTIRDIFVPADAVEGKTRMRVTNYRYGYASACGVLPERGQAEDYTVEVNYVPPCSGTPSAGTVTLNPTQGEVGSEYTVSATGYEQGVTGLIFQWQYDINSGGSWTGWTDAGSAQPVYSDYTAIVPALPGGTKIRWRLSVTCETRTKTSPHQEFTIKYCTPYTQVPETTYIRRVSFLGTLNSTNPVHTSTYSTVTPGYEDWTDIFTDNKIPRQAQGEGINVELKLNSKVKDTNNAQWRGWVDWNRNGIFETDEMIFDTSNIGTESVNIGFIIPPSTPPGEYVVRFRNYKYLTSSGWSWNRAFSPCEPFLESGGAQTGQKGEAEDYKFIVIESCKAKVTGVTNGEFCAKGSEVELGVTGSDSDGGFNWYSSEFGGTPLNTEGPTGNTWTTPALYTPTTYWVAGINSSTGCESTQRVPVRAIHKKTPEIVFDDSDPEFCGDDQTSLKISAFADTEQIILVDEEFSSSLGAFENISLASPNTSSDTNWKRQVSPYIPSKPPYMIFTPVFASGVSGDGFAVCLADVGEKSGSNYLLTKKGLQLKKPKNTNNFTELTLEFRLYFHPYMEGFEPDKEYLSIEVSTDNGATWEEVEKYTDPEGVPNKMVAKSINLDAYVDVSNFKFRFVMYSFADNTGWMDTAAALDDVKLYGSKPLETFFDWTLTGDIGFYMSDCINPYTHIPGGVSEVCIKPTEQQLEDNAVWKITADTQLSNGCNPSAEIEVVNMTKVWNTTASNDWDFVHTTNGWKPRPTMGPNDPPTADNCVIVKKTVYVNDGTHGLGKNLKVKNDGKIIIRDEGSLTITDFVKNQNSASDFIVEDGGNLIQINNFYVDNEGEITTRHFVQDMNNKFIDDMDYVYWSSPVASQNLSNFSPGTPTPHQDWGFLEYDESTDYFENTGDTHFLITKGYAIGAETSGTGIYNGYDKTYEFEGKPNNGPYNFTLSNTNEGYNLTGNPYPSNIFADVLFEMNSSTINKIVYLWTNNDPEPYQLAGEYSGNNYAVYNLSGGAPSTQAAGSGAGWQMTAIPNGTIRSGQGFIVQSKSTTGSQLKFDNFDSATDKMLRVHTAAPLFQKGNKDRYWITLTSPSQILNTALVAYVPGATNDYEADYDALFFGASDAIYSVLDDRELQIQGRQHPLDIGDVVPLGINNYEDGIYVIGLENPEGIFGDVKVYLIDKELGISHNLSKEPYKYFTRKGKTHERFEIRYRKAGFSTSADANFVTAARQKEDIIILSTLENIKEVQLFDILGMEVYQNLKVNGKELRIPAARWMNSILFAKIITEDGQVTTTKVLLK